MHSRRSDSRLLKVLALGALALGFLVLTILEPAPAAARTSQRLRHTVDSAGHSLAVFEKRPAGHAHAAVLLVHGRTWSSVPDFDLQVAGEELSLMDGLVERGFVAYAVDLRGYGATPRDDTGWATPEQSTEDVRAVLGFIAGRQGGEVPFLFGWSNGSMVAQLTAQKYPQSIAGLVLFGYPIRPGMEFRDSDVEQPPREPNTAANAASDFIVPGAISDAAIAAYVAASLEADPIRVDWRNLEQWRQLDPAAVHVPVLLIQGEHDPLAPTEAQAAFFSQVASPVREWVVVAGGDHAAFLEAPRDHFIAVLTDFMNRVNDF
jgi:alpha-beta hydrolase superfamily lysophospholipase